MKQLIFYLPIIFPILFSCMDNDNDDTENFIIGVNNANILVYELDPPILINSPDSDSIDIDGDSRFDLIFVKSPKALLTGYGIITEMLKRSGIQVILSNLNNYPDTLSYSTEINSQCNWSDVVEQRYVLQSYNCQGGSYCHDIGNFLNHKESYLGIKINSRYGWVKLYNEAFSALEIKEYSIMK